MEDYGINKKFCFNSKFPYSKAIDCLKNIQFLNSPLHKLKAIMLMGEFIHEEIEEFYLLKEENKKEKLSFEIPLNDIMMIFVYIISKSQVKTLITHCNLIDKFIRNDTLEIYSHYSFLTFRACVDYFQDIQF